MNTSLENKLKNICYNYYLKHCPQNTHSNAIVFFWTNKESVEEGSLTEKNISLFLLLINFFATSIIGSIAIIVYQLFLA